MATLLPTLRNRAARRRHRDSDSTAHTIAAGLQGSPPIASVTRIRAPRGAVVGHYTIKHGGKNNRAPIAITAAAEVLYGANVVDMPKRAPSESWQKDAWSLRRDIGELRFTGDRMARAISQSRMYIAELPDAQDAEPEPVTEGPVFVLSRMMFGDQASTQQALKRAGQHLQFNGESLLLIRQDPDTKLMTWTANSIMEITGQGETMKLEDGVNTPVPLTDNDVVVRCWTPDPEHGARADCPARAVLPVARELDGLTKHTSAQIDSRLAGAGLLIVPDTIEVLAGQSSTPAEGDEDADMDPFVRALVESMTVPLERRDSAAAIVPLVAKVPESVVDKIKHLTFSTEFDAMAKDMREEAIRRIALGMDSDPAVLLGMGSGNHWSAWLVSEDEVQLGVAPAVATVCHAFTTGWLHPVLAQMGIDPSRYIVWFDTSQLELRPDKSADSRALHEAGLLGNDAVLRENGFDPINDAPTDLEYQRRILEKLLIANPALAPDILPALGISLTITVAEPVEPVSAPAEEPVGEPNDGQDRELPPTADAPPPAAEALPVPVG